MRREETSYLLYPLMLADPASDTEPPRVKRGELVYVVDDEPMIGEIVSSVLTMEGYSTQVFTDPHKAFAAFSQSSARPVLLVTDYVMGPMNGMELIHKCRGLSPELKTILYSGNVSEDITEIYVFKPDAFMEKPFLPRTLLDLVESVLQEK